MGKSSLEIGDGTLFEHEINPFSQIIITIMVIAMKIEAIVDKN